MALPAEAGRKTYVVEHLDPELGPWSLLEYVAIAEESRDAGVGFCLSSVPEALSLPQKLLDIRGVVVEHRSVEVVYAKQRDRVCLLDPAAAEELRPDDGGKFDVFLFGGILGMPTGLLPSTKPLADLSRGSKGDDPPRDRTSELREKGFKGRRLGPIQMTTDTAVRVTRMVIQEKVPLDQIPFIDHPELRIDDHESTEMPFRYVKGRNGEPIMPKGMLDLIKQDSEKGFGDLL